MGKYAKLKEKQKWSEEKLHLENDRKLRGIYFVDPRTRNLKKPSRTRVRSWKHQWLLPCPVKLREIVGMVHPTKSRQKLACILEDDESKRLRMGESSPNHHEDILQEKETIHYSIAICFTNLFLCLKP